MKNNILKDWRNLESSQSFSNMTLSYSNTNNNLNTNNSLESLKNSIKGNIQSYKKILKEDLTSNLSLSSSGLLKSQTKKISEKEKIQEYFQTIKNSSKLNISQSIIQSLNEQSNHQSVEENSNRKNDQTQKSNNNFVIYEAFKNMLSKNKKETPRLPSVPPQNNLIDLEQLSMIQGNEYINNQNEIESTFAMNLETNVNHNNKSTPTQNSKAKVDTFYKKKYFSQKNQIKDLKKKLSQEKKISEMLTLKLFYETHKSTLSGNSAMNSTTINEDNSKITKMLTDKIKENVKVFDKLEKEIEYKDLLIKQKNDMILHQKEIIDKLIFQINGVAIPGQESQEKE